MIVELAIFIGFASKVRVEGHKFTCLIDAAHTFWTNEVLVTRQFAITMETVDDEISPRLTYRNRSAAAR